MNKHNFNVNLLARALDVPLFERMTPEPFSITNPDELEAQIPIFEQSENDCTANSWTSLAEYLLLARTGKYTPLSRRFLYEQEDVLQGQSIATDNGASSVAGAMVLKSKGTCSEALCPYGVSVEAITQAMLDDANNYKFDWYYRIKTQAGIDKLLSYGWQVSIGIQVFDGVNGLESVVSDGILSCPNSGDNCIGGHEVKIIKKVQIKGLDYYKIRNSWGISFGDRGYFYLPVNDTENYLNVTDWDCFTIGYNNFKQFSN